MGQTEELARKRVRRGEIQNAVLSAVGLAGVLLVTMAAPNTLQLLRYVPRNKYRFNNQAKNALSRLATKGLVRFVPKNGKTYAELTERGRTQLLARELAFAEKHRKRWDGRWRVVMFDIPEKQRSARDHLRWRMRGLGFYRLQDSAWVYPHDCEDLIALIKTELRLGSTVIYMIADIENDRHLREEFALRP